uniref:Uncharacterized protein n=1 Tax=Solanum lycopersicum TaxID=4081 RepID=A0A3Q7FUE8_SOLLC
MEGPSGSKTKHHRTLESCTESSVTPNKRVGCIMEAENILRIIRKFALAEDKARGVQEFCFRSKRTTPAALL